MALFRFMAGQGETLHIRAGGLLLRPPKLEDYNQWAALRTASRGFLQPWEPIWPIDDLTRSAFRRRVKRYMDEIRSDAAYPFLIFRDNDETLLGGLTLGFVRRGVAQACTLGYWMGEAYAGKGIMTHAARAASRFAFTDLALRRIEAACLPDNPSSIRLLDKLGFEREGYARRYLCINGTWCDHYLYALLREDVLGI